MNQTLMTAIRDMQTVSFSYHGEARIVEPHCYGNDTKGHDALRAYQLGGKGWRLFHLSDMSMVNLDGQSFHPRSDYKRNDSAMDRIYVQV